MKNITALPLRDLLVDARPLYVPFQLQPLDTLQDRNEFKRRKAIEWLGTRWILHPENQVRRAGNV